MIAISINMRSDKLVITGDELEMIQALTAEELAEIETQVRVRATRWLNALRQIKEIANGQR
jgi:hypothetical protein